MENLKILVIIPAYNEEESIANVVETVKREYKNCDVLVVNDGSTDNTLEEAKKTSAILIDLPNNLGIGGAVQTGYLYAYKYKYDIAIQVDGDGQHNPKHIADMVNLITTKGYNMIIRFKIYRKNKLQTNIF